MANVSEEKTSVERKSWTEKIKLIATIVGILSPILALATFIGFKPEKKKQLEWEYLSKSSLVNTSAASSDKIEVSYDGRKIKQLSVISARFSNSGALPVDSTDVKDGAFPTVVFPSSVTVIGAQIKGRVPSNLKAEISYGTNYVRLEHGLLNGSDFIEMQILLEGDPGDIAALPTVSYRISGIAAAITRFPSAPPRRVGPAFFGMPSVTEYFVLVLASLPPLFCLLGVWIISEQAIKSTFPEKQLAKRYSSIVSAADSPAVTTPQLQELLAKQAFLSLSTPIDARARDIIQNFKVQTGETKIQYQERLRQKLLDEITPKSLLGRVKAMDKGDAFGALVFLVVGASSAMVMFASWYRAITGG